jgi:hypothetical protein
VIEEKRKESCLVRSGVMRHVGWCGVVWSMEEEEEEKDRTR